MAALDTFTPLNKQRRRLQGSVNYWKHASEIWAARAAASKSAAEHADALKKKAHCDERAALSATDLAKVRQQLTDLDPKASNARRLKSTRTHLAHIRQSILTLKANLEQCEPGSKIHMHWHAMLEKRQYRLAQLVRQEIELLAERDRPRAHADNDTLAMIAATKRSPEANAIQARLPVPLTSKTSPLDRALYDGMKTAIAAALAAGEEAKALQLRDCLEQLILINQAAENPRPELNH